MMRNVALDAVANAKYEGKGCYHYEWIIGLNNYQIKEKYDTFHKGSRGDKEAHRIGQIEPNEGLGGGASYLMGMGLDEDACR